MSRKRKLTAAARSRWQLQLAERRYCPSCCKRVGTAAAPGICKRCGKAGETLVAGRVFRRARRKARRLERKAAGLPAGRVNYDRYLNSEAWARKRAERIALDGGCCVDCGSTQRLHVHHLTYRNLGNEPMIDLVTVCESCHEKRHGRTFGRRRPRTSDHRARHIHAQLDAECFARIEREA